ncbi:Baseplate J-like protein [Nitrobacter hamburgensis X14]|uniref:Baseplate J-like protein n=1 Tax=Nitrobacter hamburgensis (strain DSM 10229 / NCIMB 13809 / X14) TaxID=323097 RepID=Q1QI84_NITHX|nr:baseplate J/gp47 family protein [Nitrobacter hamburgensis]ABE64063.1 Baseplate J-like protein [Nitrobacter hamburgensis X14]
MRGLPSINLADLPLPPVLQPLDYEALLADIIAEFKTRWEAVRALHPELPSYDQQMLETDPAKIVLESAAYIYMLTLARVNDAAKALMLATTSGGDLDSFAADFDLPRLVVTPATDDAPAVMESDADYRRRRWLATEGYAAAGPEDAYRFFAMSADPSIKEALAIKGDDNRVDLVLLSRDGNGAVSGQIVSKVHAALSPLKTRPLTDSLYTRSASIIAQPISVLITVPYGPDRETVRAKALSNIAAYAGSRNALGMVLRVDGIIGAAREGNAVETMQVVSPAADVDPGPFGAVYVDGITVAVAT